MIISSLNSWAVILIFLALGFGALFLVSNELGKKAGLALPGRLMLLCGLGMGVIAFSIKAGLVMHFKYAEPKDLLVSTESVSTPNVMVEKARAPRFSTYDGLWATWQALPTVAPAPVDNRQTPGKIALG